MLHADEFYTEQMVRMNYINTIPLISVSLFVFDINCTRQMIDTIQDFSINVTEKQNLLKTLELPLDAKIMVVPGRQFKMHPTFLRVLYSIMAHFQALDASSGALKHVVVIFAESTLDFNRIIIMEIESMLMEIFSNDALYVHRIMKHVKVYSYRHYFLLSKIARAALDTFPYGGKTFC